MTIIDLHCDTLLHLMEDKNNLGIKSNYLSVDIEKLRNANSMAQFFALYIDLNNHKNPLKVCLEMIDKFHVELEFNKEYIALATSYRDLISNQKNEKISAFLTIEEGGVLAGELFNLRNFYRLGVRLITLTWNYPNQIGFPNHNFQYKDRGLKAFGRELIVQMNSLGMLIDVSHLSDQGFYDVAKLSSQPFVASHSNARSIKNHSRNLTDEMIKTLANQGGVMGINFAGAFLGETDFSRVEDMVRHIKHIKKVGGIDVVSLGTDFDGIDPPLEIENIGQIHKLIHALEKEGFSQDEIEKISYKNTLRVIREVLSE